MNYNSWEVENKFGGDQEAAILYRALRNYRSERRGLKMYLEKIQGGLCDNNLSDEIDLISAMMNRIKRNDSPAD